MLVIDDSILEKAHTDANALLYMHYDHSLGRYVKGLNFVRLLYVASAYSVPPPEGRAILTTATKLTYELKLPGALLQLLKSGFR